MSSFDRYSHLDTHDSSADRAGAATAPGKRTLTEAIQRRASASAPATASPSSSTTTTATSAATPHFEDPFALHLGAAAAPVQRKGEGAALPETDVHAAAAQGIQGSGSSLPFLAQIQASFGKHDVSHVRAHVGGAATAASAAIGAQAYATGQSVAFAHAPDLHTVAHEAAHVVQQRAGVHLKGGVGEVGDVYERHADQVAELVVQGKSAESLLDEYSGASSSASSSAVQRKPFDALSPLGQARAEARTSNVFAAKAEAFEVGTGKLTFESKESKEVVELMMGKVARIATAYADHVDGVAPKDTFAEEFAFAEGDIYYGAFQLTGDAIADVLADYKHAPLRTQLKLIYNACRNNNLAKWLKLAAIEMKDKISPPPMLGLGGPPPPMMAPPPPMMKGMGLPPPSNNQKAKLKGPNDTAKIRDIKPGFALDSGIEDIFTTDNQLGRRTLDIAQRELKEVPDPHHRGKTLKVHHSDDRSEVMQSAKELEPTKTSKRYDANVGMPVEEQQTITRDEVPDLTVEEYDQLRVNKKKGPLKDPGKRDTFVGKKHKHVPWVQGRESIDVLVSSEVERTATELRARLDAGISGSTDLMLHAAQNLGMSDLEMKKLRIAMIGWMVSNRDHSLYEIQVAAKNYGLPFIEKDPVSGVIGHPIPAYFYEAPENFAPFDVGQLKDILPEKEFPSHFLGAAPREDHAEKVSVDEEDVDKSADHLKKAGVPDDIIDFLVKKDDVASLAHIDELRLLISGAGLEDQTTGLDQEKTGRSNRWKRRTIRKSLPFLHLTHSCPVHAETVLAALIPDESKTVDDAFMHTAAGELPALDSFDAKDPDQRDLRQYLVDRGVPEGLAKDKTQSAGFVVERMVRLAAIVAVSSFNTANDSIADKQNFETLAVLRTTDLWAEISSYYGKAPTDTGGGGNLALFGLCKHKAPTVDFLSLVYRPQLTEHKEALDAGVPPPAIGSWSATHPWKVLEALIGEVKRIVSLKGAPDATYQALADLEMNPDYIAVRGTTDKWMLAIIAGVAKKEGLVFSLHLSGKRLALAAAFGTLYQGKIDSGDIPAQLGSQKTATWNTQEATDNVDSNAKKHSSDPPSQEKTLLENNARDLNNLTPEQRYAIYQYSKLDGMGPMHQAIRDRDFNPRNAAPDSLGGMGLKLTALVSGLQDLPVYASATYNGQAIPSDVRGTKDEWVRREYPVGKVITKTGPLSTARTADASFINKATHEIAWEISGVKTGHLIQMGSLNEGEQEVLFAPGARFVVTKVEMNRDFSGMNKFWVHLTEV